MSLSGHPSVAGPAMRPPSTRSANRTAIAKAPVVKDKLKEKPAGTEQRLILSFFFFVFISFVLDLFIYLFLAYNILEIF